MYLSVQKGVRVQKVKVVLLLKQIQQGHQICILDGEIMGTVKATVCSFFIMIIYTKVSHFLKINVFSLNCHEFSFIKMLTYM